MRDVKVDRIADRHAEWLKLVGAFEILGALPLVERQTGGAVILLFDPLRLQKRFRFRFVFEELPIATFADLGPGDAVERTPIDPYFAQLRSSLAHGHER